MNNAVVESENQTGVSKRGKLITKLLEIINKFSKRININSRYFEDLLINKKSRSNSSSDLSRCKSHDNLDFIKYINGISGKDIQEQIIHFYGDDEKKSEKWEPLSQIHHTPRMDCCPLNSFRHQRSGNAISRHKSMSDLINLFPNFSGTKQTEKLNSVLDFVVTHFLNKSNNDILSKSIDDLIVESCVQIILQSSFIIQEKLIKRTIIKNSNYVSAICSTENSSSDSDTKLTSINRGTDVKTPNNSVYSYKNENELSRDSKLLVERNQKPKLNMRNITSPIFQENSAFKYRAKVTKAPSKFSKKIIKKENNNDRNTCKEFSHYISAKKASLQPQISKYHITSSMDSEKSVSCNDNNPSIINNNEIKKKPLFTKSIKNRTKNGKISPTFKTKIGYQSTYIFKKTSTKNCIKEENINEKQKVDSPTRNVNKTDFSTKLKITKVASVNCSESDTCSFSKESSNIKVLNVKFNDNSEKKYSMKNLRATPITFVFAGTNNSKIKNSSNQFQSNPSNLKYISCELSESNNETLKSDSTILKSKTTFGRNSGYCNEGRKRMQVSNYFVVNADEVDFPFMIRLGNSNNNSEINPDYSKLLNFIQPSNFKSSIKSNSELSKLSELVNISVSAIVNNRNAKETDDSSDPHNTDSSYTFHAVKAKYCKQYFSVTYDSENDNLTSATNELSQCINIDHNLEEEKKVKEPIVSENDVAKISVGDTYSCDEKYSLFDIKSKPYPSKYNTSSDDDTNSRGQKYLSNTFLDDYTKIASDLSSIERNSPNEKEKSKEFTTTNVIEKSNIISTSIIDVSPLDLNNMQYKSMDLMKDSFLDKIDRGFNMVYCRSIDDKKSKKAQKSISDNLLKHTFASQQKIRLKHE